MNRQAVCLVLVFAFIISLFGCAKKIKPADTVQGGFECDFVLKLDETEYKGHAEIKGETLAEFSFSSPESISDLTLKLKNDTYTANFAGITYEGSINELPKQNPITNIYNVLFLNHNTKDLKSDDSGYFAEEEVSGNGYKIYYRADGFPKKIVLTNTETAIEFSNISYLFN